MTPHLAEALKLIGPESEEKDACAAMITQRVELLRQIAHPSACGPSPGELKKELRDIARDLRGIRKALGQYSEIATGLIFRKDAVKRKAFLTELDELIDSARFHHGAVVVRRGSRRWDNIKALTARLAAELLRTFSTSPLTKTAGGPFYALASLLYEGITGEGDVNLEQYCRNVLDHASEPGGGRIEPSIVVKVPSARH